MIVAIIVAIIGAIILVYGHSKDKKYLKYGGGAFLAGGLAVAIGSWAWENFKTPDDDGSTTAGPGMAAGNGFPVSTPS